MGILHTQFASGALLTAGSDYGNLGTSGLNEFTNRINVESGILGTVSGAGFVVSGASVLNTTHKSSDGSDHADVVSNTNASHTQGTDTTLGIQTANLDMGVFAINNCGTITMGTNKDINDVDDLRGKDSGDGMGIINTHFIKPLVNNNSAIGTGALKYSTLYSVSLNTGDIVFSEKKCALCNKDFKKGESVVNYVLSNTEEGTRTIPVHIDCALLSENQTEEKNDEVIQKLKDEGIYIDPIVAFNKNK